MARGEWGYNGGRAKWCSYRRTTLIICSINIGVALYVLHTLYTSLYNYPFNDSQNGMRKALIFSVLHFILVDILKNPFANWVKFAIFVMFNACMLMGLL